MPFFLDGNPTSSEISEAVNYLLSNFGQSVGADPNTGQIIGPGGVIQGYLYKYMDVKYADSFDGTSGFSNTQTNKAYYGLRNTNDVVESTNPADYIWYKVVGGFGTTKSLYYLTTGGRSIQFQVATAVPNPGWVVDGGAPIDLDFTTSAPNTPANFVVIRIPNNSAAPTDAEVLAAIGRLPISGDLCTVNYNSGIYSLTFKYTTGWAIFQKYITGDLIVANTVTATNIAANTITAGQIAANTITAGQIAANTITAGQIAANTITASQIASNTITASQIASNTITAGQIASSTITATQIASNTITASNMVTGTITAASAILANASVDTLQIAGNAVTVPVSATSTSNTVSVSVTLASGNNVLITGYVSTSYPYIVVGPTRDVRIDYSGASGSGTVNIVVNVIDGPGGGVNYWSATPISGIFTATSAGSHTFTITTSNNSSGGGSAIQVLGTKR